MHAALLVCVSPERKTIPLHLADSKLVGRADKCHLRYDDAPALSSVHCRLQLTDDGVVLDDSSTCAPTTTTKEPPTFPRPYPDHSPHTPPS